MMRSQRVQLGLNGKSQESFFRKRAFNSSFSQKSIQFLNERMKLVIESDFDHSFFEAPVHERGEK
jgi:hypothetical protein